VGAVSATWYGQDPQWWVPFEAEARVRCGPDLKVTLHANKVVYRVCVDVLGRPGKTPVTLTFYGVPPYYCYGLPPRDYPLVHADLGAESPHRLPGDALCLYKPVDPPERRWRAEHGLLALINLTRRHLFLEDGWRLTGGYGTGGRRKGVWAGDESHGFTEEDAA